MSNGQIWIAILVAAGVSLLVRVLPLTLIRRKITNRFLRSFLYYVPYATLAVMTFPAIMYATQTPVAMMVTSVPSCRRSAFPQENL